MKTLNHIVFDYFISPSSKFNCLFGINSKSNRNNHIKIITFYKTIQNKFHFAITGHTAAEIVYNRVDAKKIICDLLRGRILLMARY